MRKAQLQTSKRICREGMRGYFHKLVRLSESLTESLCYVKELARLGETTLADASCSEILIKLETATEKKKNELAHTSKTCQVSLND
ncbi:hypothetical protein DPMN_145296 [Dreissena polymorpha]|uniref:Uncharacterized protein n=1 Tax=Dreissena polymorpha TaxID=45954 RepID=A0A9D4F5Q3_DREPO|nr:hypothetical protein DPMN_145296 [Dreissena polymorpha]